MIYTFKWGNKVSITDDHNQTINMKSENLTAKYAALIALHKEMEKRKMSELPAIGPGGTSTKGHAIDSVYWLASSWNGSENVSTDKAGIGVQYDDWFIFVSCRNFAYFSNSDVPGWTQKVTAGIVNYDNVNHSLNIGDATGPQYGFAAAVYKR